MMVMMMMMVMMNINNTDYDDDNNNDNNNNNDNTDNEFLNLFFKVFATKATSPVFNTNSTETRYQYHTAEVN